jgi:hypothetical protein
MLATAAAQGKVGCPDKTIRIVPVSRALRPLMPLPKLRKAMTEDVALENLAIMVVIMTQAAYDPRPTPTAV